MLKLCKGLSPGKPISIRGFNVSTSKNPLKLNIPLNGSIIPLKGMQAVPSFNRNTTATVVDHEGIIHTALINEIRFPGARRVRNLLESTEDFTSVSWINYLSRLTITSGFTGYDGRASASRLDVSGISSLLTNNTTVVVGAKYILSIWMKGVDGGEEVEVDFKSSSSSGSSGTLRTLTTDWVRYQEEFTAEYTTQGLQIRSGALTQSFYICCPQFELVTGSQTEASEYVSVGVLSRPYHGACVDGVKYFTTDRDGSSLDVDGALIEPSATNLITYSEALSSWSNNWGGGTTLTANATLGPHGRYAYKVAQVDSVGDGIYIAATLTITTHTVTLLAKNYNAKQSRLLIRDATTSATLASLAFNWVDGVPSTAVINNVSGIEYKELFNGWYLVTFSFVSVSSGMHQFILYPELVETATIGVYFGGLQVETGGSASSYIYTSGSITTKTEDSPVYSVQNIIQDVGSLYLEFLLKGLSSSTTYIMSIDDATSSNRINLAISSGTTLTVGMISGGTSTVSSALMAVSKNNVYKIVVTYKNNSFNVYINGTLVLTDTSCTVPTTLSYLRFAKYDNSGQTNLSVKKLIYFSEILSSTKAIRMTS